MTEIDKHIKLLLDKKDLENPTSFEELGYIFLGPLVFNFFIWLKKEMDETDLILFNSREGYFLEKLYKIFETKYNLPKSVYFKTSRKISSISSFFTKDDVYNTFKLHRYSGTIGNLLNDRFGITDIIDNTIVDTNNNIPDLEKYIDTILESAKKTRLEYGVYIKNIIGDYKNVMMVDSGFQGMTQYNIQNTFDINLKGRYITYKGNLSLKDTKGFCDFYKANFKDNIIFFESIFTDKIGTYVDIIDGEFVNENIEILYFDKKEKIIEGIKSFINDMFKFDINSNETQYEYSEYIFNLMCKKDYIKNDSLFDIFFHDNYYSRDSIKKIDRL
jgi:hypothetical protein